MIYISLFRKKTEEILKILSKNKKAEIRFDSFQFSKDDFLKIINSSDKLIVTFRKVKKIKDSFREVVLLNSLGKAEFVDIDIENDSEFLKKIQKQKKKTKLIISYHNFRETPNLKFLKEKISEIFALKADVVKIACFINSKNDLENILKLYKFVEEEFPAKKIISLGMGKKGVVTRVLANFFGSPVTYASYSEKFKSAKGQISYSEIKKILKMIKMN